MCAKPRSIVMPRRFSSSRRSASIPVRALTKAVLPLAMCPAVPTIMDFIWVAILPERPSRLGSRVEKWSRRPYPAALLNATIELPHDHLHDLCLPSGDSPAAWPHLRRVRKDQAASWATRTDAHRAWHLQRDVERTLFVQVVARSSETSAHTQ